MPLVIIGRRTNYDDALIGYAERYGMNNRLFIRHQVDDADMPAIYQSAKLFIYPSVFEGFGIPVIEALASGVPVITNNFSSLPEAAGPGSILTDTNSAEHLGHAIIDVLSDTEKRTIMIEQGYQHVAMFSRENVVKKLTKIYSELV